MFSFSPRLRNDLDFPHTFQMGVPITRPLKTCDMFFLMFLNDSTEHVVRLVSTHHLGSPKNFSNNVNTSSKHHPLFWQLHIKKNKFQVTPQKEAGSPSKPPWRSGLVLGSVWLTLIYITSTCCKTSWFLEGSEGI